MRIATLAIALLLSGAAYAAKADSKIINDSWYTMQSGSTPWGFYHEIIEEKDDKYSYRYNMTKIEKRTVVQENIGAICKTDFTPIAFNVNKQGVGAMESITATYSTNQFGGVFNIKTEGARTGELKRTISKDTILDVFFPVWLSKRWKQYKTGSRGWVTTFAEDPENGTFLSRKVTFVIGDLMKSKNCTTIHVTMDTEKFDWCMEPNGRLIDVKVGNFHIERVQNEATAKAFVKGVMPK